jgi:hypothetical protein
MLGMDGTTQIGAEYAVGTRWNYYDLYQYTTLLKIGEETMVDIKTKLTTVTRSNRLYITVPLDCIGNPSDGVDIVGQTAAIDANGLLISSYDWLPDPGAINLPTQPSDHPIVQGDRQEVNRTPQAGRW